MFDRPNFKNNNQATNSDCGYASPPPAVTLPKGGGAIKGMGEKFAANPVTGTGSMSVPLATSPGRAGFGPQLSLSYDSGAGNGSFGFGWNLSLPSITRKTDKGLPQYLDMEESDVFILSGAEDLVPVLAEAGGQWHQEILPPRVVDGIEYQIRRYRSRIEGLFARIERWTNVADLSDVHWHSISKDNILTLYGKDINSRITDPSDPTRIFSWLICETRDDKGNAILYEYKSEDDVKVDLTQVHERNRGDLHDPIRTANRYLKRTLYGNQVSLLDEDGQRPSFLTQDEIDDAGWMFEVVFDYDEHDPDDPKPNDTGEWSVRNDSFSSYRSGFEIRTYRLCQRVLMFHHIPDLPDGSKGYDGLVRSTDFTYAYEQNPTDARNPIYSFLLSVAQTGYKRNPAGGYIQESLPLLEFTYSQPQIDETVREVDPTSLENLPQGLDGSRYQWVDLDGEGLPGILTEQGDGWFYKRNLSPISAVQDNGETHVEARFAPVELVATKPAIALAGGAQFLDLAGDGQPDLVGLRSATPGFYERTHDEGWETFVPFKSLPVMDWDNPNLKFIDLNGDGHSDILITENDCLVWHRSLAEDGFGEAERTYQPWDEEKGPRVVFADSTQSIYLSDMSGDGLADIVRIRNGEVCYWPNLGYGRFGSKVTMDNAPWFDATDIFNQRRIVLADIDGSGTTDILYLSSEGVQVYFNQSGNGWSAKQVLRSFPAIDNVASVTAIDLLGNGTACLVWSSPLPGNGRRVMRYIDLMGGQKPQQKPHLLIKVVNNLGAETVVQYAPSTKFYLQDKLARQPWITKLPFPVHVVKRLETRDYISGNRFVSCYSYHHGYFDGEEREFRGFGYVEQVDTEAFDLFQGDGVTNATDENLHIPPILTKTWFHTGFYLDREHISQLFAEEYYAGDAQAVLLADTILPDGLSSQEEREACRALRGQVLRQEVYALDESEQAEYPYTVTESNYDIRLVQPLANERYAVFFTHLRESIAYQYERNPDDPRIAHQMTLEVDEFGNILKSVEIAYPRRTPEHPEQGQTLVTYTENKVTNKPDEDNWYRLGVPIETITYEITGLPAASLYTLEEVRGQLTNASSLAYEATPTAGVLQKRVIEHIRNYYRADSQANTIDPVRLSLGEVESLALPCESFKLAFTPGLLNSIYNSKIRTGELNNLLSQEGKYVRLEGRANASKFCKPYVA
ncbi:MAG: SpvB/TcaC N-terminal domain-containing protein, partial [Waterburya sp.]